VGWAKWYDNTYTFLLLLLLLLNRLPPDITGGQGLKKTFFKQYI
jgi:hypothetical protein